MADSRYRIGYRKLQLFSLHIIPYLRLSSPPTRLSLAVGELGRVFVIRLCHNQSQNNSVTHTTALGGDLAFES